MAPDPRFGLAAPFIASTTIRTPSGLTATANQTKSVELADPENPMSLVSQTETTAINGRVTRSVFNAAARTVTTTTPENRSIVTTLDTLGRPVSIQIGTTLLPTTLTYDEQGRVAARTRGARTTTFEYDARGFLASVTDPRSRSVRFNNDFTGRLMSQTLPDLQEVAFGYDANGNLTSLTPPGRPAHTMQYTPVNLLQQYQSPTVDAAPTITQYQFNLAKQPSTITRSDGQQATWQYDTAGRVERITTPTGTTGYTYQSTTGQLATVTSPSGVMAYSYDGELPTAETVSGFTTGSVAWDYDAFFRTATERVNAANAIAFTYDADNLLTGAGALTYTRRAGDGFPLTATVGSTLTTFTHSALGELATEDTAQGGTPIYRGVYTRDKGGRLSERTETIGGTATTEAYGYDLMGRLTTVTRDGVLLTFYAYDNNGNRTGVTTSAGTIAASYDAQDRVLTVGDRTYTHSADGEVQAWTDTTGTTTLTYDVDGNLLTVNRPGRIVEYVVDGRNRRIGRKLNGIVTHRWLYRDQLRPIAELDADGALSRFVYGVRPAAPEYMIRGGTIYRLITDHLGSVRLVVDISTGSITQRLDYDAWGVVALDTNPGFQPFGYAGGLFDSATGFVRFGARDYDPVIGRWTTRDPIISGTNVYEYANNDPIGRVDSNGLYGRETHFDLTYELAVQAGMGYSTAHAIASGNQGTDEDRNTWPYGTIAARRSYHFVTQAQLDRLRAAAFTGCYDAKSLKAFGQYLHALQDSYSHQDGQVRRDGTPFSPVHGHKTHWPDIPANRPELYIEVTNHTRREIAAFKAQLPFPK